MLSDSWIPAIQMTAALATNNTSKTDELSTPWAGTTPCRGGYALRYALCLDVSLFWMCRCFRAVDQGKLRDGADSSRSCGP